MDLTVFTGIAEFERVLIHQRTSGAPLTARVFTRVVPILATVIRRNMPSKVIAITEASNGIGKAAALHLAASVVNFAAAIIGDL